MLSLQKLHLQNQAQYMLISNFSSAIATPAAAPSKSFIIEITVPSIGSYYLAKGGKGLGTKNIAEATTCSVTAKTELLCDGKYIVGSGSLNDMVPLKQNSGQSITTGFSLGADQLLHWKNSKFSLAKEIEKNQGGEAGWALYPKNGGVQLYAQLGTFSPHSIQDALFKRVVANMEFYRMPQGAI
jgi:hypothetical protein